MADLSQVVDALWGRSGTKIQAEGFSENDVERISGKSALPVESR
jgi:hypothetical protein